MQCEASRCPETAVLRVESDETGEVFRLCTDCFDGMIRPLRATRPSLSVTELE